MKFFDEKENKRKENINELVQNFKEYLDYFNRKRPFKPKQLSAYKDVLSLRRENSLNELFDSNVFYGRLYNALEAWDMNKRGARMKPLNKFRSSISSNKERFLELANYKLVELDESEFVEVCGEADDLYSNLNLMDSEANLVANSKLMHFVLPDLIMPVDRRHVLKFFYGRKEGEFDRKFSEILNFSYVIAKKIDVGEYLDDKWNQSIPKMIDNSIVGYIKKNKPKTQVKPEIDEKTLDEIFKDI